MNTNILEYRLLDKTEYIYDPFSYEFRGYRLSGRAYKTVKPDRENRIYSQVAGLYLAIRNQNTDTPNRSDYNS